MEKIRFNPTASTSNGSKIYINEIEFYTGKIGTSVLVDDVESEYNRIKSLGYTNFKLKNGQIVYEVEGEKLFKIKAPEGTEIEIRDTDI